MNDYTSFLDIKIVADREGKLSTGQDGELFDTRRGEAVLQDGCTNSTSGSSQDDMHGSNKMYLF